MMAGNPNWWSMINGMHPPQPPQFVYGNPNFPLIPSSNSTPDHDHDHHNHHHHHHLPSQDFPVRSWSQLLMGGLGGGGEERFGSNNLFQQQNNKKLENWEEDRLLNLNPCFPAAVRVIDHVKHELIAPQSSSPHHQFYDNNINDHFQSNVRSNNSNNCSWPVSVSVSSVSSPNSCTTTALSNNNNFLNFSAAKQGRKRQHNPTDHSSEGNSTSSGGVHPKKARVQHSAAQPALKVRKEKLGDRITALHQLVSPFGKTDTASVLSEAIGYIRFLEAQIEALSSPYMRNASGNNSTLHHQQHSDTEGPGLKDLRSRGLCLVPVSCTQNYMPGTDGGADYWAPGAYGGASPF